MGRYNFDNIIDRRHTDCLKFDFAVKRGKPADVNPFWIADMDFEVPVEVKEALLKRVAHGIYGYTETGESYFNAVKQWFTKRFNWTPEKEWLVKTPGIVYALAMAVQAFTSEGDAVILQQPVYYPFSSVIKSNNRKLINVPMVREGSTYTVDFDSFERAIVEHNVKLFLLCNPHNPIGRVYRREELLRFAEICLKHNVMVVSDEIHADFVWAPHVHTTYATLGAEYVNNCMVCTAPSKTFNLAGLQISNVFIPNEKLRKRFTKQMEKSGYSQLGTFGIVACEAAYTYGEEWLDELKAYIWENIQFTRNYFEEYLAPLEVFVPEGTYLMWFDCEKLGMTGAERDRWMLEEAKLWLDSGAMFGPDGEAFERINVACPRIALEKGLAQLRQALDVRKK